MQEDVIAGKKISGTVTVIMMNKRDYVEGRNRNLLIVSLILSLGLVVLGDPALGGAFFLFSLVLGWKRENNTNRERN